MLARLRNRMGLETECKLRVDSHDPIRERLVARGATHLKRVLETNHLFDRPDGSLRAAGCALRVREVRNTHGEGPTLDCVLTFKGRLKRGAFKSREEIEFGVSDAAATILVLNELG